MDRIQPHLDNILEQKEAIMMRRFKLINGFDATDDHIKRVLFGNCFKEVFGVYAESDEQLNQLLEFIATDDWTDMIRIGWKPRFKDNAYDSVNEHSPNLH